MTRKFPVAGLGLGEDGVLQWGRVLDDAEMVARTTGDSVTGYEPVFERLLPLSIGYVAKVALFWS